MTYMKLGVKDSFMSMTTFVAIVAFCDLWPIIVYVTTIKNDVL